MENTKHFALILCTMDNTKRLRLLICLCMLSFLILLLLAIFSRPSPAHSPSSTPYPSTPSSPSPSPSPKSPSGSLPISPSIQSLPAVSAFFIIGDSTVDCSINYYPVTLARADRLPYGRDFDTHQPTGRFCNGRIPVDYLALHLGLPFVPSYIGRAAAVEDMMKGVNYAYDDAGINFCIGSEQGINNTLKHQIQQVYDTIEQISLNIGEEATSELIMNSVFYISIGINDYMDHYLRNMSGVMSSKLPWSFNKLLVLTMKQEIKNLYLADVRKVVVMGLAPIGCAPYYLWQYRSRNGTCINEINNMILEFNFALRYMVSELNEELMGSKIIFCDAFQGFMDIMNNPRRFGFSVINDACCGSGKYKGWLPCRSVDMACSNASTHIWWDQFHPTDAVNAILAENVWSSTFTSMCYPMNLQGLIGRSL